jgi:putative pyruvate formate lyase activating enzyme
MIHPWEEPFLAGEGGSGAVFFTGCSLRCVFCQNRPVSAEDRGRDLSPSDLSERLLDLQRQGAENIDLVSPTHFTEDLVAVVRLAHSLGLSIPVVWNSSGYELPETLAMVASTVDVFLPDLKYHSTKISRDLCGVGDYFPVATKAIQSMHDIVGSNRYEGTRLVRGLAIRHLVLPGLLSETFAILDWIAAHLPLDTPISLMRQYTPLYGALDGIEGYPSLSRRLTTYEYVKATDHAEALGLSNLWLQEKGSASESYTPDFPSNEDF